MPHNQVRPFIALQETWSKDRLCDWCDQPADMQTLDGSLACLKHGNLIGQEPGNVPILFQVCPPVPSRLRGN